MKKAQINPMEIIILFVILAVVAAILIYFFSGSISKEKSITENQLSGLEDSDKDGVANYLDKCPNTPVGTSVDSNGCPIQS